MLLKKTKKLNTEYKNGLLQAINVIRKTLFDVIEATDGASVTSIQRMVAELVNEMTRITKLNTEQFWNLMESTDKKDTVIILHKAGIMWELSLMSVR